MNPLQVLSQREYQRARARWISDPHRQSQVTDVNPSIVSHYSIENGMRKHEFNRYMDICPYDRNQILIGSRYLNASWVLERHGGKWWIASQAPLPSTSHAFLSLLLNPVLPPSNSRTFRVRTVVQLTRHSESGITKAHPYFPSTIGDTMVLDPEADCELPPLEATLDHAEYIESASCLISTVSIHHGVPTDENRETLLSLLKLVERTNRSLSADDPPIVVGCSAGVGRTGSFIALASLLRAHQVLPFAKYPTSPEVVPQSQLGPVLMDDAVVQEIDFLREQRPSMVQRNEQVIMIYEMLHAILHIG
ncbi:phosphatases II [Hymenopellis radicata]|nr:phosphatases II [Hymenopellis radicata]